MKHNIFDNIVETFAYFDRPLLFISQINDRKFICTLISMRGNAEFWLSSEINDTSIELLRTQELDYYHCFKNTPSGISQMLQVVNCYIVSENDVVSSSIPDESLPLRGTYHLSYMRS